MTIEEINSAPAFDYDTFPKTDEEFEYMLNRLADTPARPTKAFLPVSITLYEKQKEFFDSLAEGDIDFNKWKR